MMGRPGPLFYTRHPFWDLLYRVSLRRGWRCSRWIGERYAAAILRRHNRQTPRPPSPVYGVSSEDAAHAGVRRRDDRGGW